MATPHEKLAAALEALKVIQALGRQAIRSADLSRTDRELLQKNGFLQEVMKGWYIAAKPGLGDGESTAWFASFWSFCRDYLNERFGEDWSLTPEQSLVLHAGNLSVPKQLLVRAKGGRNHPTEFVHGTSLFDAAHALPSADDVVVLNGLRLFKIEPALIAAGPAFFEQYATEARTVLSTLPDASALLTRLLEGGHSKVAGRLAGAFRNIGRPREADAILAAMRAASHTMREVDPFAEKFERVAYVRDPSPHAQRIRLMWQKMRGQIAGHFPEPPPPINDIDVYLKQVDDIYVQDAYHSLSIEGYQVSGELIEKVRSGTWNPEVDEGDREHRNALAARGYWQAFQATRKSLSDVLAGANAGEVADRDHGEWYRQLFQPSVAAGLSKPENLAGYRNIPIYISRSRHVPMGFDAVPDAMSAFFDVLRAETDPAVRAVLGHFVFVYIHPYRDGNGRTGRFLMNVMLGAGGYPWTVVPVGERARYMATLESASAGQDIVPFAEFLGSLVGQPAPKAG